MIDDEKTPDKNEAIYDVMMMTFPTPAQANGTFKLVMNLYDTETKMKFNTYVLELKCSDYAILKETGFQKGTRTYFCIDIIKGGRLKLKEVSVTPWGEDVSLNDGAGNVELPDK